MAPPPPGGVWNELLDGQGRVRPYWADMNARIQGWTADERKTLLDETGRMLEDLGTTFNVYRDVGGAGQPYEIDPIPFIMESQEWDIVAKGLAQRMRLLEAVLSDLYGPRLLLKDGLVPRRIWCMPARPSITRPETSIHPEKNGCSRVVAILCEGRMGFGRFCGIIRIRPAAWGRLWRTGVWFRLFYRISSI